VNEMAGLSEYALRDYSMHVRIPIDKRAPSLHGPDTPRKRWRCGSWRERRNRRRLPVRKRIARSPTPHGRACREATGRSGNIPAVVEES
jgi:hypothetical protein